MGNFAKSLQSGADAFSTIGGVMNAGIDIANTGVQAAANSFTAAGNAMSNSTNPKLKKLGIVAGIAGPLIGGLGNAAAETAKFMTDFLMAEGKKLAEGFTKMSSSGALFADGMTGMKNTAHDAGLGIKQFSEVVGRNSQALGQSGLGVTEGAKQLSRVASDLKKSGVRDQLMNLGYSVEEQADMIAQTTANMRRSAGGKVSDAEVAAQTAKYAENLRTIAAITGEDAKKKVEEAQQQNQILAFQQKMAGKSAEQRAQIDAAMATMTETEKKNFRDRVVLGTVINQEGAIYESTVKGAKEKGEAALALFNNNKLTAEANANLNAQYGEQIKQSVLSNQALGTAAYAAGGVLTDVAKGQLDALNQSNTYTKEGVAAAEKNVQDQKNTQDKATDNINKMQLAANDMAVKIEDIAQNQLPKFGEAVKNVISTINKQLGIKESGKEEGEQSWIGKKIGGAVDWMKEPGHISGVLKGAGMATEMAGLAADATGVGAVAGVPMNVLGAVLGGLGLGAEMLGFATGGISYGDPGSRDGGQLARVSEGGIAEAHVPLPDGKRIPVDLGSAGLGGDAGLVPVLTRLVTVLESNSPSSAPMGMGGMMGLGGGISDSLANVFGEMKDTMAKQLEAHEEIANHSRDHKDLLDKLLKVSM
jgi:hypothetical protein